MFIIYLDYFKCGKVKSVLAHRLHAAGVLQKADFIWFTWDIPNVDKLERTVPVFLSYGDREKHVQQKRTVQ